jgi:hypothetical protein
LRKSSKYDKTDKIQVTQHNSDKLLIGTLSELILKKLNIELTLIANNQSKLKTLVVKVLSRKNEKKTNVFYTFEFDQT